MAGPTLCNTPSLPHRNAGLKAGGIGLPCPILSNIRSTSPDAPINFFFLNAFVSLGLIFIMERTVVFLKPPVTVTSWPGAECGVGQERWKIPWRGFLF